MAKQKVDRFKINPPLGRMPVLQNLLPAELEVDGAYQRSIEAADSQGLIKQIAQHWNWDLCQPLVVSRRRGEEACDRYFVIDGQHRLEAAKVRGDINQLPCVVLEFPSPADEAASFVHLNQARRPLNKLQLFKAAVAGGDREACQIAEAIAEAGLSIAPHNTSIAWKAGMVNNIGGIEAAWRRRGERAAKLSLKALAEGFSSQVMQYAGTIYPGIAAVCHDEINRGGAFAGPRYERFVNMLALRSQADWRLLIHKAKGDNPNLNFSGASETALRAAWASAAATPVAPPVPVAARVAPAPPAPIAASAARWCDQCDARISPTAAAACTSRFCKMKEVA